MIKIYKTLTWYAEEKEIHFNTALQRKWTRIQEVKVWEKKVWYIDIYETLHEISLLINR